MDDKVKRRLDRIDARTGTYATDEQQEFASDFTQPLVSFSNPGTGKSHSIVKGLLLAETHYGIPGNRINAMSYTTDATSELSIRYKAACKKCGMTPTVTFNTFHSICYTIVREVYPKMNIKSGYDFSEDGDLGVMKGYLEDLGHPVDDWYKLKNILLAMENLNHALVYDDRHVELSYRFRELDIPLDVFQKLRLKMFTCGLNTKKITQGDIPNYALFILATRPELQARYKEKYQIMVVDEFQDMTKLYLVILSMISSNLIVIGDMKQQIYGFNGACSEIVDEYMKIYPNARRVDLTQSFRCKNEIADFATTIYQPNDRFVKAFSGTADGGSVNIVPTSNMDVHSIIKKVKSDLATTDRYNIRDTMFLFRNNFSITPIAEELYQQGIPFRVKKFQTVMDFPIYNEYCNLANIAMNPSSDQFLSHIPRLFPEFRKFNEYNCPFLKMRAEMIRTTYRSVSIFDVKYAFKEESSKEFMAALKRASEYIKQGRTAAEVFSCFEAIYDKYIIEGNWWRLPMKKEYYEGLVSDIIQKKTYPLMFSEEMDKFKKTNDAVNNNIGVKCYTMHSAKGLEADDVYILDAESAFFPSIKNLNKLIKAGCEYEAARVIREERNLLYVGITRAKENVYISYSAELTELISNPQNNKYSYLDEIYAATNQEFDDIGAFGRLLNIGNKIKDGLGTSYKSGEEASKVAESSDVYTEGNENQFNLEDL